MTANLTVKTAEKNNTLFVPTRAVLYEGNNTYVQVLHLINNKEDIEKRKVVVGLQGDENIEIVEGINENDQIVTFTKAT